MNREERAKQFMPFDALKGLGDALRMKEYEHDRVYKSDLSEEKVLEISGVLSAIKKNDSIEVNYFDDGHYFCEKGKCNIDITSRKLFLPNVTIDFEQIFDIKIIK